MAATPLTGACVWVSCNSRGWMEDRLSGSQGRVDRLLKTVERDATASVHTNSQNRHTVLVKESRSAPAMQHRREALHLQSFL
ncbi:Hypothetical protein SMAX5B_006392 [Scophthalmus maximus]|uniref:Uncharacterized protein n=1 Tax=Scophthalmus maximus TaxID=52904 RepID=A0A2U9BK95_SCOMX|nr:Hypothetical protein SMAX5B_006392 [Scophthalmus maximus]